LTPQLEVAADVAWLWSAGEEPIYAPWTTEAGRRTREDYRSRFRAENRPWGSASDLPTVSGSGEIVSREVAIRNVQFALIAAAKSGMMADALHKAVDVAMAVVNGSPDGTGPGEAR